MLKGVTPIETAFEMVGLANSQAFMKWIFFDTMGGALIFCFGFVTSLAISVEKGSFKALWTFLILFFASFFLFVIPTARPGTTISTMEQSGYTDLSTQDIINEKGYGDYQINPVLSVISDLMSGLNIGLVSVLDNLAGGGRNAYLQNPFLITKLSTIVNEALFDGIDDPQLKKDTVTFYQDEYLPALRAYMERSGTVKDIPDMWPGATIILALYSTEAKSDWLDLKERLKTYVLNKLSSKKNDTSLVEKINGVFKSSLDSDALAEKLVQKLLKYDIKKTPTAYENQSWQHAGFADVSQDIKSKKNFWTNVGYTLSNTGALLAQPVVVAISHSMLHGAPYVQGFCIMLMLSFFPFTIIWMVLQRDPKIFVEFLKNLFWVKSWTLCWSVVNVASVYVWEIQRLLAKSDGWDVALESPHFMMVTCVFMIATPVVTYSLLTGAMSGLGVVATMANLHADKGVEMANKTTQGAVDGAIGIRKEVKKAGGIRGFIGKNWGSGSGDSA